MNLFVATHNAGKMREYRDLLAPLGVPVLFPPDLGLQVEVVESGATYAENARLKALAHLHALRERGVEAVVLADDSGLEVDALDGAPGIRSARYTPGSDEDRIAALLRHLEGVPWERRTARFRCVLAVVPPDGALRFFEGICEGIIATEPAGEGGFGYDPVFYLPEQGCTMAQLPPGAKNRISHRARAVQAAMPVLRRLSLTR
ncbi:MAG TPA: RdgB/HAM1 family non-canonical purine NTP pyrophosphatase [Thermoflexia bacterium]|jgi:XTP/dITP diphosphohydrolase|nr:RdgB/HAM1 family non-canonical purine NTP pyrophosphatase [Thermoflexia bacterium]